MATKPIQMTVRTNLFGQPFVNVDVEVRRIEDTHDGLPRYEVLRDGERIGTVFRRTITVERKTRGNRYVHHRHESPPNYWGANDYQMDYLTRARAVEEVVRDQLRRDEENES